MTDDFPQLLNAAKEGADWAWERLYDDLARPLTGYFASRGAPEPEDLTAETFLHLARGIHSFDGNEQSMRSWAFVIAHRRMIDARRAASRRVAEVSELAWEPSGGNVEDDAMTRLSTAEIVRALEVLTDEQRDVIALRVIADLSLEETAQIVDKTRGAVKALQHRALETLRASLQGVSNSDGRAITDV